MTPSTSIKVALVMRAIRAKRAAGELPEDAPVSTAYMARISREISAPLAEITFRRIERVALAKLAAAVLTLIEAEAAPNSSDPS